MRGGRAGAGGGFRAGFTLLELSLSLVIVATIAIGLGSAVVIASRAVPVEDAPSRRIIENQRALDRMALEMSEASFFTERGATAVGFVVPDRDGDGDPEHIRYAWGGSAGQALTRSINGASAIGVIDDVSDARLAYATRTVVETLDGAWTAGSVSQVSGYETGNDATRKVTSSSWIGQRFVADALPAGVERWCLKGVDIHVKQDGIASGDLIVRLEGVDGSGLPDGVVIAEAIVSESALASGWYAVSLQDASLFAGRAYALTLRTTSTSSVGVVSYDASMSAISGRAMLTGDGSAWSASTTASMLFRVRGAALTQGSDIALAREHVVSVSGEVTPGARDTAIARVRAGTLNAPEVLDLRWDTTFDRDPTQGDSNGDGTADWFAASQFDGASLSGGVWTATQTISSRPNRGFTKTTTIEARVRDTTVNGEAGASIGMKVDQSAGNLAQLDLFVLARDDDEQLVLLRCRDSATTTFPLAEHVVAHGDFVEIRVIVLGAQDAVSLWVDGSEVGTYTYTRISGFVQGEISLLSAGGDSGAQFDSVSIRVSPTP